jgi:hypothetical protein
MPLFLGNPPLPDGLIHGVGVAATQGTRGMNFRLNRRVPSCTAAASSPRWNQDMLPDDRHPPRSVAGACSRRRTWRSGNAAAPLNLVGPGRVGHAQSGLELRLELPRHLGPGKEVLHGRELAQRIQPETL